MAAGRADPPWSCSGLDYGVTGEALRNALGDRCAEYMKRTRRLLPGVY